MIHRYWTSFSILPNMVLNNAWLEASSMAAGDGTPGATANSGGPARYSASWVGQMMSLVAPRQSALLGQQRIPVGQLGIHTLGINSEVSLSLLTLSIRTFGATANNVRITATP
ncbi:hypothetical protein AVEN_11489-1 [Araneus ventricosus]|uniref:Uncharacterized protein n=1 Tax=Araneus ventricosus TaxID=182803 RepID=A0A4Y2ITF0_ARAVE|nr:hypothetical protein AVEN_11489-1 [Araneus ventricosus]